MKNIIFFLFLISQIFSLQLNAQGGDAAPAAAAAPVALPFSAAGTTVGKVNNYNLPTGFASSYTTGPDWLYYFCATSTSQVIINCTFTADAVNGVWPSVSIWQGVPGVGTLIASATTPGTTTTSVGAAFTPVIGTCYYVMVDNWPTPNGFAYNMSIQNPPAPVLQPACTNIGYDNGNFTGWAGSWSNSVTTGAVGSVTPTYTPTNFNTSTVQHTITTGAAVDALAGFPQVCPGLGPNSMRLGDGPIAGNGGATIEQNFSVTASNALFTYNYAVVITDAVNIVYYLDYTGLADSLDIFGAPVAIQNAAGTGDSITRHAPEEQPYFKVDLKDCSGNPIVCGQYLVVGGEGIPGFTQIGAGSVYYKAWTSVFIDLTPYIGSCVTIKYSVADCSLGAHYCYAYIDATCAPMVINGPTYVCPNGTGTLTSPIGGVAYSWSVVGTLGTILGTAQTLSVSPVTATTNYQCVVTSVTGCSTTLTFVVTLYALPTVTSTSTAVCAGTAATITATGLVVGGTYSWSPPVVSTAALTQTPAATTTYTVTYTDLNLCTATATGIITVNPVPLAPVTAPVVYCQNAATIPLTATISALPVGNVLNWYTVPVGGIGSLTAPTPSSVTAGPTTYYVSQTTALGCEGPRATLIVTINALPVITVNSLTICPNVTAVLTAVGGTTYVWDANPVLTANPYSVTPLATTSYTVVGTTLGCSGTATATVIVANVLTITVNSPTICSGSTAVLTAFGGTTYVWNATPALTANPYSVSPVITTIYTVVGTTNGCSGTATATVTVNPIPTTTAGSNSPICAGTTLNLLAVASVVPGATYGWTGPNGFTSAVQNPTIAGATVAATGVYTVTVTANTCTSISTVNVIVNAAPITIAGSNTPLCVGDNLNLTATNSVGSIFGWTGPLAYTSAVQNPTINAVTLAQAGSYIVTVTANGCSSTSTVVVVVVAPTIPVFPAINAVCEGSVAPILLNPSSDGITGTWVSPTVSTSITGPTTYNFTPNTGQCALPTSLIVTVNPLPVLVITNPLDVCEPFTVDITAASVAAGSLGGGVISYWTNAAGTIPLTSPSAVGVDGIYFIESTALGCTAISPVAVVIHPLPLASFSPNPTILTNINPFSLMTNTSIGAVTYSWDFGDGEISNLTNPNHYFPDTDSGTYIITLTATTSFGCVDVAVETVKVNEELLFYVPNTFTPDKDNFNEVFLPIFTSGFDPYDYRLLIFDRWGTIIFESHDAKVGWKGLYGVDGDMVQDDTYTWKIDFTVKSDHQRKSIVGHVNVLR